MSLVEELHQAKKDRDARIAARAVPDMGINMKNGHPVKVEPPPQPDPQNPEPEWNDFPLDDLIKNAEAIERQIGEISDFALRRIKISEIQRAVCRYFSIDRTRLLSKRRSHDVVRPRQIAMYLCKTLSCHSFPEIGRRFGGMDHTTALHAARKIEELIAVDAKLAEAVAHITEELRDMAAAKGESFSHWGIIA